MPKTTEEKASLLDSLGILREAEGERIAAALHLMEIFADDPRKAAILGLMVGTIHQMGEEKMAEHGGHVAWPMVMSFLEVIMEISARICKAHTPDDDTDLSGGEVV